jgi:hypothetical protein
VPEVTESNVPVRLTVEDRTSISLSLENNTGFDMNPTGITVIGEPTLQQFGEALERCGRMANATTWAIGDLIVYAEGRGDWGEMYSQFLDDMSHSYHQIAQAARVSKAYPPGELRQYADRLSWTHHRETMAAEPGNRLELLASASEHEWSCLQLREQLRENLTLNASAEAATEPPAIAAAPPPAWPDAVSVSVECKNPTCAEIVRELLGDPNRFHVVVND